MERMTVGDLKKELADVPDDWPVILAVDEEGNGFQPLYEAGISRWHEEWREIKLFELTDELREKGYDEEDVNEDLPPVLVLWP